MVSVGSRLKEARERKKISINTVAKNLNISIMQIELMEDDNFSKLPGGAYNIGYIRTYSNFLYLDAEKIVKLYKDQISFSNNNELIEIQKPIKTFNFFISYKLISFFGVTSLSLFFYFMFVNGKNDNLYYAITPDILENLQYKIEEIELEEALMNLEKEKIELSKITSANLALDEKKLLDNYTNTNKVIAALPSDINDQNFDNLITIKALDNTWIQLRDNNNEIIYSSLMHLNEEHTYSMNDNYNITTGNAGNLIISINGQVKGRLGKKGEIIETLIITSDFFN